MTIVRFLSLALSTLWLVAMASGASAANIVKTQAPCSPDPCVTFSTPGNLPAIRSIAFSAPSRGTAVVTFHGTLYCLSDNANFANINLGTQIVEGSEAIDVHGPGGLVFFLGFEPAPGSSRFQTVNLASTRVFAIAAAGSKTYRFKIRAADMAAQTSCLVFNGVLTVNFSS